VKAFKELKPDAVVVEFELPREEAMTKQIEDEFNLPRLEDALKAQAEANGEQRSC
jgi:hypothetical protein